MTTLSPGFCSNCGKQTDTNFKYCEHCAADLSQFRQPPQSISQAPTNADESSEAKSLKKRYKDAYRVARTTTGVGSTIKGVGALLGILIFLGVFALAAGQRNVYGVRGGDIQVISLIVGAIFGGTVWLVFFIWGVLVSAQGQILKASLDGAVNGSPFLTNEQRATIMSL
jgi:hypothetical protein